MSVPSIWSHMLLRNFLSSLVLVEETRFWIKLEVGKVIRKKRDLGTIFPISSDYGLKINRKWPIIHKFIQIALKKISVFLNFHSYSTIIINGRTSLLGVENI